MYKMTAFAAAAALMMFAGAAHADGDAAAGEKVFAKCKACHEVEKGVNKVGPTLKGVVGRPAASVADYKYSEAMLAKGAEGLIWTEENLAAYLPDPKAYVPKTKMAFAGLKKPEDVANVIAYLKAHP
ncbi:c-type cytochrome [Aestuariivirga sp.]|jgi:cytochrome c|uniref:c-type cytochrome n=1 Tax=Aestuariivirga sp. TaxID=2650926 RepID=UPI0037842A9C